METKLKERLKGNGVYGVFKDLKTAYQKMSRLSVKSSKVTVAAFTLYETSKAHRTHMLEFERNRAHASVEAYRQTLRGQ